MKNKKSSIRHSLIFSATALVLTVAMLIGTTFAWFTDTVTSGKNTIKSGNLKVTLQHLEDSTWKDVGASTNVFKDDTLWEPGHVEYAVLKVGNAGSLALKYRLSAKVDTEVEGKTENDDPIKLSNYLYYSVLDGNAAEGKTRSELIQAAGNGTQLSAGYSSTDTSLSAGKEKIVTLVVWMPITIGNEANYRGNDIPTIKLGINLVATQYTEESDSFDNTYDKNAEYPIVTSASVEVNDEGKVASETKLVSSQTIEGTDDPVAEATVPANAKTTATEGDDSVQLVLDIHEIAPRDIDNIDTTLKKRRTLEVTMDGIAADNTEPILVKAYIEPGLDDLVLYHSDTKMIDDGADATPTENQHYSYDPTTGYVTFLTRTFSPFTTVYRKDYWEKHAAESFSEIDKENKTLTIHSAEELALFATNITDNDVNYSGYTVKLANDIDLGDDYLWRPIKANGKFSGSTIDGQGYTIRNMTARNCTNISGYGAGFIGDTSGAITIKNISFDNADVTFLDYAKKQYWGNVGSIVLGYTYGTTVFENVSVTNSEIWGYGKIGCLLGMGADPGVSVTFKGCVSKNNTIHGNYDMGGLAGMIQRGNGVDNGHVENCTVDNITVDYDPTDTYVDINNATATFKTSDTPSSEEYTKVITGKYLDEDGYYWCAYGNYYVSYGHSSYDAPVEGYTKCLANSEYPVNE